MRKFLLSLVVICFTVVQTFAQNALIVKQEGQKVYLDISDFTEKPKVNDTFNITFWGSELKNPKTGKVLGKIIERRLNGVINVVEELFAVGTVHDWKDEKLEGLDVNIERTVPPSTVQQNTVSTDKQNNIKPLWQSDPLESKAVAVTAADIDGTGDSKLVLAYGDNNIKTYTWKDDKLVEGITLQFNPLYKILSLDSADLNGNGKAEIFVDYYDTTRERLAAAVYELEGEQFAEKATVRGLVKGIAPYNKERALYVQEIKNISGRAQYLTPALLVYQDGAYKAGAKLQAQKFNNIFGFNLGIFKELTNKTDIIYTQQSGRLRLQFEKKGAYLNSPDGYDFATTPTRLKLGNDMLRFYSSLALYNADDNKPVVAGIVNEAKLGILSNTFGYYHRGKLVFLKWNGSSLEYQKEAPLGGYAVDLVQGSLGRNYKDVIIVPFMTGADQTIVAVFEER